MARHVFHRDFTICRAAVLAALIGLAWMLGDVPTPHADAGGAQLHKVGVFVVTPACDWKGVSL